MPLLTACAVTCRGIFNKGGEKFVRGVRWLGDGDRDSDETIMDADALRLIQQGEMEIGSHTLSHPLLHRLSPDERVLEIRESKSQLENVLGLAVESFAYPYGVYIL